MAEVGDTLPDEDFEALNAEGDEEEDDDQPVEGYETEDEAPPEVRASHADGLNGCPPPSGRDVQVGFDEVAIALRSIARRTGLGTHRPRSVRSLVSPHDAYAPTLVQRSPLPVPLLKHLRRADVHPFHGHGVTITQVPDETAAEVARRERERLRAQTQAKRQQLEKMRAQDMFSGAETEVRHMPADTQTQSGVP